MISSIQYWISLMGTWWNIIINNALFSVSVVSIVFVFVIKYLDQIKKIFK